MDPDPRVCTSEITDPDADPGGPKTYGSYRSGCGFGKLVHLHHSSKTSRFLAARARPCAARTRLFGLIATPNGALRAPVPAHRSFLFDPQKYITDKQDDRQRILDEYMIDKNS